MTQLANADMAGPTPLFPSRHNQIKLGHEYNTWLGVAQPMSEASHTFKGINSTHAWFRLDMLDGSRVSGEPHANAGFRKGMNQTAHRSETAQPHNI